MGCYKEFSIIGTATSTIGSLSAGREKRGLEALPRWDTRAGFPASETRSHSPEIYYCLAGYRSDGDGDNNGCPHVLLRPVLFTTVDKNSYRIRVNPFEVTRCPDDSVCLVYLVTGFDSPCLDAVATPVKQGVVDDIILLVHCV